MRAPLLVSLALHAAAGAALVLLGGTRADPQPGITVEIGIRADVPPEVARPPADPAIPEPTYTPDPWEFPEEAPEPEPVEAPSDEPATGLRVGVPARVVRLPTPLPRPARAAPAPPAAPHAVARSAPKGDLRLPHLLVDRSPEARYPARARRMGLEGTVVLLLAIAADGTVAKVELATSSGHEDLDNAARDAAASWRFEPARQGGVAVPYDVRVPVEFRLTDA